MVILLYGQCFTLEYGILRRNEMKDYLFGFVFGFAFIYLLVMGVATYIKTVEQFGPIF